MADGKDSADSVRIDVWLDVSCLFKTRSEAQKACKGGKVSVNGQSAKPTAPCSRETRSASAARTDERSGLW